MAYCTQVHIEAAVGGAAALQWITDLENQTVNTVAVASAIEWAGAQIDMYATGTPGTGTTEGALWSTTPAQAKQAAIDLAVYCLYDRIRRDIPESVKATYESTMSLLAKLAEGKISWVTTEPPAVQNAATVYYHGPGSTARTANPRRTRRDQFDNF